MSSWAGGASSTLTGWPTERLKQLSFQVPTVMVASEGQTGHHEACGRWCAPSVQLGKCTRAQRSRLRSKTRWWWRGLSCLLGPPGLAVLGDADCLSGTDPHQEGPGDDAGAVVQDGQGYSGCGNAGPKGQFLEDGWHCAGWSAPPVGVLTVGGSSGASTADDGPVARGVLLLGGQDRQCDPRGHGGGPPQEEGVRRQKQRRRSGRWHARANTKKLDSFDEGLVEHAEAGKGDFVRHSQQEGSGEGAGTVDQEDEGHSGCESAGPKGEFLEGGRHSAGWNAPPVAALSVGGRVGASAADDGPIVREALPLGGQDWQCDPRGQVGSLPQEKGAKRPNEGRCSWRWHARASTKTLHSIEEGLEENAEAEEGDFVWQEDKRRMPCGDEGLGRSANVIPEEVTTSHTGVRQALCGPAEARAMLDAFGDRLLAVAGTAVRCVAWAAELGEIKKRVRPYRHDEEVREGLAEAEECVAFMTEDPDEESDCTSEGGDSEEGDSFHTSSELDALVAVSTGIIKGDDARAASGAVGAAISTSQ